MPTINIENVNPLISNESLDGKSMTFVFSCPVSATQVTASHAVQIAAGGQPDGMSKIKKTAISSLRGPLSSAIRGAFGRGTVGKMLGSIASKSASTAIAESAKGARTPRISGEQRDAAAVAAFRSVSGQFEWDSTRSTWVSSQAAAELMSGFQRQVGSAPIDSAYDQEVSWRMMVEVASADGELQGEEREILALFIDPSRCSIEELVQRPALSSAELAEVSQGAVRKSMLSIAWLIALANDGCDAAEAMRLESFASSLELEGEEATSARHLAEEFLVEQMLTKEQSSGDAQHSRAVIQDLADSIGMSQDRLERAEARFHKRRSFSAA